MRKLGMIFSLVLAIAIVVVVPRLLEVRQRGKQRVTVTYLRDIGIAIETYKEDHGVYPSLEQQTIRSLASYLEPEYAESLHKTDGWRRPFAVSVTPESYELRSYGKDGVADTFPTAGAVVGFVADLVFSNGQFEQWPEGY